MSHIEALEPIQLDGAVVEEITADWIWRGFLARGSVTVLTSLWKTGKTTLLSVLLSRMHEGGLLANRPLAAGRAAVVTEEPLRLWQERRQHLNLGPHVYFFPRPFRHLPTTTEWHGLIAALDRLREHKGIDLAVIDPLATFLPARTESHRDYMMEALLPLRRLTEAGMALLLLHHPRKGDPPLGEAARGTGSLTSFADIVLEMRALGRPTRSDRRRRIQAMSRFNSTPEDFIIELNESGTDYLARGSYADEEQRGLWPTLLGILDRAEQKLTRAHIQERWPTPDNKPSDATLWRLLEHAVAQGDLAKDGKGHHPRPYRYWLADREVEPGTLRDLPELGDLLPERLSRR